METFACRSTEGLRYLIFIAKRFENKWPPIVTMPMLQMKLSR